MNRVRHVPWTPRHEHRMPTLYIGHVPCLSAGIPSPFGFLWIPVPGWGLN